MKTRFTTLDVTAVVFELQESLVGLRVQHVYDIDSKTYLIRFQGNNEKHVLLLESGSRIHTTNFEWPKNQFPSGFTMKLRKHITNKRLVSIRQVGWDRIVVLTFGTGPAAYHIILELYDHGNIILTDGEHHILNILRKRRDNTTDQKFLVKEIYQIQDYDPKPLEYPTLETLDSVKPNESVKSVVSRYFRFGPNLLEHLLLERNLKPSSKWKNFEGDKLNLLQSLDEDGEEFVKSLTTNIFPIIVQKGEKRPDSQDELLTYLSFLPCMLNQFQNMEPKLLLKDFSGYNSCVDEFFSKIEGQKIEQKTLKQEQKAFQKLENVRNDLAQRLEKLEKEGDSNKMKGWLIEYNKENVELALLVIRKALSSKMDWKEIQSLFDSSKETDPIIAMITRLQFEKNHFSMLLKNPYEEDSEAVEVDIDIDLNVYENVYKYFHLKKSASLKKTRTLESQSMALKSAERRTKQELKKVETISNIKKARKTFWFEKFYWFISSENYLIIGGRDVQQNELIVKRYLNKTSDIYVHADIHGASSIVIKNPTNEPVPPKTLNEAGVAAVCYSSGWDSKIVTNAWWVHGSQVSKSAPTGEYLTPGSFMIRGKKNFLPPCQLTLGFGFMFKLGDESVSRHLNERKVRTLNEEYVTKDEVEVIENEIHVSDDESGKENDDNENKLTDMGKEIDMEKETDVEENSKGKEFENDPDVIQKEESIDDSDEEKKVVENDVEDDSSKKTEDINSDEDEIEFPDTNVEISYSSTSGQVHVKIRKDEHSQQLNFRDNKEKDQRTLNDEQTSSKNKKQQQQPQPQQPKRGKKGKLKKIKEKYRDQDSEEKEIRMQLLQGSSKKGTSKKMEKKAAALQKEKEKREARDRHRERLQNAHKNKEIKASEDGDVDEEDDLSSTVVQDVEVLNTLTGIPTEEDELLFCLPVVAPYQVLTNYKFKVKVTPGFGKRGKATKTALNIFNIDKSTTSREKDLFKSVKDQDLSRNFPGKVKLSAPQLSKAVKSKK